jgi:sigma-B regulation protein RsbU (phosphoserine phosphatase)
MRLRLLVACFLTVRVFAQSALYIDLSGSWQQSADDKPAYAAASFDDSKWRSVVLPGPAARFGAPSGIHWLSRTVPVPEWADVTQLAITLGSVSEVYEIYVNGVLIGGTGAFSADKALIARPRTFNIPADAAGTSGSLRVAIRYARLVLAPTAWTLSDSGPYLLTYSAQAPVGAGAAFLAEGALRFSPKAVFAALEGLIALPLALAWFAERRRELLLLALFLTLTSLDNVYSLAVISAGSHPWNRNGAPVLEISLSSLSVFVLSGFVLTALWPRSVWPHAVLWLGWVPFPLAVALGWHYGTVFFWNNGLAPLVALFAILVDWRRQTGKPDSRQKHLFHLVLLLPLISGLDRFITRLVTNKRHWEYWMMGPYRIERQDLTILILASAVVVVLLRRIAADRRDRVRLAGEFEAARAVQQMMIAQAPGTSRIVAIDAGYRPAQEVGGDFYCVLEDAGGARILVVGDVSGKGLKAALLVSLVIGALRTTEKREPAALLAELNRAVHGQTDGGFVTCCCARFSETGGVAIANAGHLSPYLNGREVEVAGGLPLGVIAVQDYNETGFNLHPGERLVFLSDGVVEAANAKHELFGFERTRALSTQSATDIADAAQTFGQNDDITVVTVRRTA